MYKKYQTVINGILKRKLKLYTAFMKNCVGWNKNICKLSCVNLMRTVSCAIKDLICS